MVFKVALHSTSYVEDFLVCADTIETSLNHVIKVKGEFNTSIHVICKEMSQDINSYLSNGQHVNNRLENDPSKDNQMTNVEKSSGEAPNLWNRWALMD